MTLISLYIHYADGNKTFTRFNGTAAEAERYYVNTVFNVGTGSRDNLKQCVRIEILEN